MEELLCWEMPAEVLKAVETAKRAFFGGNKAFLNT